MITYLATITRKTDHLDICRREAYVIVAILGNIQDAVIALMRDLSASDDIIAVEVRELNAPGTYKA